jgi:carboxypeptidase Taq
MYQVAAYAQEVWARARAENDFERFRPHLERTFDIKRRVAACFPEAQAPYDALIDEFEPGQTAAAVRAMFAELKAELVPLVQAIAACPPPDDGMLRRHYPAARQLALADEAVKGFGYDFNAGRQDQSAHPFTTSFGPRDVRITTRVREDYLPTCLMGSLHECGHALYDQGIPVKLARSPLGRYASLGIHESQSRLWENLVGRSRPFWRFFFPRLQAAFADNLANVDHEAFYRAINKVQPSLIRVEADEVTYNLHTLLRFELEVDLLEGRLEARHAPEAWNARMKDYLGVDVPDDARGVLQDTHWSAGLVGYFPTYTIGNLGSAQLFERALADLSNLEDEIERGNFQPLLGWLRANVHAHGAKYLPGELLERATGKPLSARPYLAYLYRKYQEIYEMGGIQPANTSAE